MSALIHLFPIRMTLLAVICLCLMACDRSESISADQLDLDKNIDLVATSTQRWTGVAISEEGRLFVSYPNWTTDHTISVAELSGADKAPRSFPDEEWNNWSEEKNPSTHFINVQSVFVDQDNVLWILDSGNPKRDGRLQGVIAGGAKLIKADLHTNTIIEVILLSDAVEADSYLNDVRINEQRHVAYITDSNAPALLIVNLLSGEARRVFENHPSTTSQNKLLTVEGEPVTNLNDQYLSVHVNGIVISKDYTRLYWRSLTGEQLHSIDLESLHDLSLTDETLASRIKTEGPLPPSDGMIIGYYNELYLTAIEENAIRAYAWGNYTRLVKQRDDFKWPDSFALGQDGYLYFTTSQTHLNAPTEPYKLFRFQVRF